MSTPSAASKDSSHSNPVRSLEAVSYGNHVSSTASKTEPKAIATPALAQRDGADALSQPIADDPDHRNGHSHSLGSNGVLSDDEGSDPNTPRLPPTKLGNTDFETIPHEEALSLDLLDQQNRKPLSSQLGAKRYPYPSSGLAANIFSSSSSEPGIEIPNKPSGNDNIVLPSSYGHDKSSIRLWLEKSQQAYNPSTNETIPQPYASRAKSFRVGSNVPMSGTKDQKGTQTSIGPDPERLIATGARTEAFSEEKRNRSSSRSSQSRVEKRFEATVAEAEPSSHARSRKSSHVLGLFKENKSSHDIKNGPERERMTSDHAIDTSTTETCTRSDETSELRQECRPILDETHEHNEGLGTIEGPRRTQYGSGDPQLQPKKGTQLLQQLPRTPSTKGSSANGFKRSRSETDLTADDWRAAPVQRPERTDNVPQPVIPPRLLEEIRDFHNLTTSFHDKFKSVQQKSAGTVSVQKDQETIDQGWKSRSPKQETSGEVRTLQLSREPENEDEESEHISSALYYPHQAPSPDALEDISIDDARKRKDSQLQTGTNLPDPALPITEDEKAEDVEIALQVHNKNRYLHGDLQKARSSSLELESDGHPALETGFSSASESEYEFLDETKSTNLLDDSSLTDDAEATPRASPKTRQSYLLSRSRRAHRAPKAPLGAVELKPYNHQVGGHTTVFRFSKRAVCKQLTNRENEFYEIIERQHPDLLDFLPR